MIDDIELARALHVLFVVHWIGGVAFVTVVALPLARSKGEAKAGWAMFEAIESRFAALRTPFSAHSIGIAWLRA